MTKEGYEKFLEDSRRDAYLTRKKVDQMTEERDREKVKAEIMQADLQKDEDELEELKR